MSEDPTTTTAAEYEAQVRPYVRSLESMIEHLQRELERAYQRALDAESHAAFGPMDVDERVRSLRALVDVLKRERDEAWANNERLRAALLSRSAGGDP